MTDRSIVGLQGVYEIIGLMVKDACETYIDKKFIRKPKPNDSYKKLGEIRKSGKERYDAYMFLKTSHLVAGVGMDGIQVLAMYISEAISKNLHKRLKNFPYIKWLREELTTIRKGITPCFIPKYVDLALKYKHI